MKENILSLKTKTEGAMEGGVTTSVPRPYIGMSGLAHPCGRYLWYSFRWCYTKDINARLSRIFERGHLEEPRIFRDLEKIGAIVSHKEHEMVDFTGHIKGHCDAVVRNIPDSGKRHVLEIKTMKNAKFNLLKKKGVEEANPIYYGQMQVYMHFMKLDRALFIVTNKDTEERYYERVKFVKQISEFMLARAEDIIQSEVLPAKIGNADWFQCKFCDAKETCHYEEKTVKTCRTCVNIEIHDNGAWKCGNAKVGEQHDLSIEEQTKACGEYDAFASLSTNSY